MSVSLIQSAVSLPQSPFPPLAVGFMGLGTGYLIYGPQELFGYPSLKPDLPKLGGWGERALGSFTSARVLAYVPGVRRGAEFRTQLRAAALTALMRAGLREAGG